MVYNGLARTEFASKIEDLLASSFYEPIRSKQLFFTLFPANSLGGVIYGDIFWKNYVNESGESIEFDSYMIPEDSLELGQFRLLDVDNKVIVPVDTHIRLIVTGVIYALIILLNIIRILIYAGTSYNLINLPILQVLKRGYND